MHTPSCSNCSKANPPSVFRKTVKSGGFFYRTSDRKWVRRFRCTHCGKHFSRATSHRAVRQKKRHLNTKLYELLSSGVSQRRAARLLRISRTTVARKLIYLGKKAEENLRRQNLLKPMATIVEFDDMETFEHTKYKPVSITLAVENSSRRILGFKVSQMPAKGLLAKRAVKKYGPRKDERGKARDQLFKELVPLVSTMAQFKSDENPHYPASVKRYFPQARYETFKGQRGSIVGQGELKKIRFDPLFRLNHTCAMFRANVNRLFRRTWCTTKKRERLRMHLAIYANYHNELLI